MDITIHMRKSQQVVGRLMRLLKRERQLSKWASKRLILKMLKLTTYKPSKCLGFSISTVHAESNCELCIIYFLNREECYKCGERNHIVVYCTSETLRPLKAVESSMIDSSKESETQTASSVDTDANKGSIV